MWNVHVTCVLLTPLRHRPLAKCPGSCSPACHSACVSAGERAGVTHDLDVRVCAVSCGLSAHNCLSPPCAVSRAFAGQPGHHTRVGTGRRVVMATRRRHDAGVPPTGAGAGAGASAVPRVGCGSCSRVGVTPSKP
eukprot:CAMPEP_0206175796 /NCGR_PEP_ID=MMETSP1474-20131121/56118_1 /ASSEMBLY_ACC=CAM_ASM_001110 /TAXON_ID=97495 /ORGANISM="Imantonia sp., Strain RCC918" /LENGTH=134 /DNA_ID=CAMNT_0053586331 /DNA_START=167 /DNA_END=571 /DNA_ORIENTATION=-